MNIVIPTRGRVGKQHTINNLPLELYSNIVIVCPPEENHSALIRRISEPHPMDYSEKFQWIINGCDGQLDSKIIIMDDDLRFSMRNRHKGGQLIEANDQHILTNIWDVLMKMDSTPLVGIHPRAMGNTAPRGWKYNGRINAIHGINRKLLPSGIKVDQFPILADMVLNLTLLTSGYSNAICCDLFWDQVGGSNAPGGCSLHRTWEQQRDAVLGLKEMFPDFVTVKEKVVKNGWWGDKPRYDFIIHWKKAYEYGQSRLRGSTGVLDNGAGSNSYTEGEWPTSPLD